MTNDLSRFGMTRSDIARNHALLTPESFEWTTVPGWDGVEVAWNISPDMGAKFAMGHLRAQAGGRMSAAASGLVRFVFVQSGRLTLSSGEALEPDHYAYLPADADITLSLAENTCAIILEWRFTPLAGHAAPQKLVGALAQIEGQPLRGDDWLMVQKMLPTDVGFDGEVNIMNFHPGASLAYVETHFMEHGLVMLEGGGIYRLDGAWYPVQAGDAIWMGPHVPQWFGALGRTASRYLIYKNYNRSPMVTREV